LAIGLDTPDAFGALRLQLNQNGAGYQYINTAGTIMDSGSVACSGAPVDTTPPSRPTNLTATSSDSNLVHLTWKASTDNVGVTGYDIFRDGARLTTVRPVTSYDDLSVLPDTAYSYRIRARDAAGNVSSQTSAVTVNTPGLLFSDGFEGGNFTQWTSATGLTVQSQQVYAGALAARGTSNGIATYATKQLSQTQNELYYRLWFKILSQNATSQVYLQRFRTSTNGAIMGVFVNTNNKLSFRNDVTAISTTSSTTVTQGVWHELQTRVLINGTTGATEVWLDGTRLADLSKTENFGNTQIGLIQLGETSTGRTYDIVLDRVALSTNFIDPSEPPEIIPTPTPTSPVPPTSTPTNSGGTIFADVPANYWARSYIERLYSAGITGGCGVSPLSYCPTSPVTRAQMAIFLLRAEHGSGYVPPAASGTVFGDVSASYWAAAWIEQLAAEGITGGCGSGSYCPEGIVSRDQMAVFLLRTEHGSGYVPPLGSGSLFGDVSASYWAGAWIEQLVAEGIAAGCGNGNFCPTISVTRDQMAVFLVRTFHLP
jgi:chitodextrinase